MRLLLLTLLLAGCATGPKADIPIATSCVKQAPEKPATKSEPELLAMTEYAATITVWSERLLLKGYAEKAEAVISACK